MLSFRYSKMTPRLGMLSMIDEDVEPGDDEEGDLAAEWHKRKPIGISCL